VTDAQVHGGDDHAYRLRVSPPRPDFAVIVTPASLNVRGGKLVPFTAHAVRRDGFDGEIELSLRDAPSGFALSGARIPAGRDSIRMTLAAPAGRRGQSIELEIVGRARIGRRIVAREAIPAEEMMQAFGLRHLVPAQRLLVSILRPWSGAPAMRLADDRRTRIPAAGKAEVAVMVPGLPPAGKVSFELSDPPPGVTLHDVRIERRTLILVFAAAQGKATVGLADNLIVEAYTDVGTGRRRGKGKGKAKSKPKVRQAPRRVLLGVLPAVPFVIIDGP